MKLMARLLIVFSVLSSVGAQAQDVAATTALADARKLIAAGPPCERYGRRPVLFILATPYFLLAVGCGLAWDWWSLLLFRFIGGLAIGASSVVAPMNSAEISPAALRGRLGALRAP
jgi:MFS family permease